MAGIIYISSTCHLLALCNPELSTGLRLHITVSTISDSLSAIVASQTAEADAERKFSLEHTDRYEKEGKIVTIAIAD